MMAELRENLAACLDAINIYKTPHDENRQVHWQILAILAYLSLYRSHNQDLDSLLNPEASDTLIHDPFLPNLLAQVQ